MAKDTKACGVISGIGMANNHVTAHTYGDRNQRHHMTANRDDGNPTHHVMTSSGDGNLRHHISAPVCEEKPTNHLTAAGEITRYLNVYNAKLMAVVFVSEEHSWDPCDFVEKYIRELQLTLENLTTYDESNFYFDIFASLTAEICEQNTNPGANSCTWLLSDGRFQGYNAWQPYGCMIHKYTKLESRNCMHYISYWGGHNNIVFLGDSRIRQIYFEFINLLQPQVTMPFKAHSSLSYMDDKINLKVKFFWHPCVDSNMEESYKTLVKEKPKNRPNLLITGSATHTLKMFNASDDALVEFKAIGVNRTVESRSLLLPVLHFWIQPSDSSNQAGFPKKNISEANLSNIVKYFDELSNTTDVLWMLQDPVVEHKLSANRTMITNIHIDEYNRAAIETVSKSKAQFWSSSRLVAQGYNADSEDGLHAGKVALTWDVQILMNKYCNDHMNFNDGTCCSSSEPVTTLQIITAGIFGVSLLVYLIMAVWLRRPPWKKNPPRVEYTKLHQTTLDGSIEETRSCCTNHVYEFFASMARLGVIMSFFLLCDRTNFFMKENKYYTHVNFFLPFSYLMILGFFFTEKSDQNTFLHRDQTDEWKGWMQLVILIYHLTGASQVLHIYMQIRVLVSSYLFLSGYGNFYYFFMKGDFSFYRFCKVMFRFNFLVVLLCFIMNRPYQFYYFIPLVSFWFLILYFTVVVWPQVTSASVDSHSVQYLYLVLKIVALAVAITLLYASEVFFEKVFLTNPIKALFVTSDDSVQDWTFRWSLDRYSVLYGVVFALCILTAKKLKIFDDSHDGLLLPKLISWVVVCFSFCGLLGYAIFIGFCRTKEECNEIHPYLAFVPIVSYIFLRNIFGWVRCKYSTFFAWFGQISLELFIAQYHIWLAADTHGVLVLVPNYQVMNVIITSFVFVCAAHEIHALTIKLTDYAVPNDWRILLRNLICFIAVLIPVAITHGAFGV
ncbi:hypothetical protein LSH36_951g03010 [Paralvinella palmiformis]|uniref:Cas1p 10 TM acyl transferase domain-containing protein n=1 Tax=Paralvinella palmiformis TaxID=53620 RepID=A0AAD9IX27_9ANNE|nr:hypothetical protein LSH36_951g03010 [Paralvinella palmiformis]